MLETAETNIKIELYDEDNIEESYNMWIQQLDNLIEEAKNLVCKAIEVSKLILNSGQFFFQSLRKF